MDTTEVCVVGAGPSGLALGIALAQQGVKSVILEKNVNITEDPRGAVLTEDCIRILHALGVGDRLPEIGHEMKFLNFHTADYRNPPFFALPFNQDPQSQTLPDMISQSQPKLEKVMRDVAMSSELCEIRLGCEVFHRSENDAGVTVVYKDTTGKELTVRCSWLVGADGKRGVVRKQFLERSAGIRQMTGKMNYEKTWVIANLQLTVPTPETHPLFPLWEHGLSPSQVYDLFWPEDWHFCCPPGTPVACGRLSRPEYGLWRQEISLNHWDDSMDAYEVLRANLQLMMTRHADASGNLFERPVTYPADCIEILRCAPALFTQKVVNRWFNDRIILIGDAAHVFPPFAGEGIASGIGDAHGLAWRLALLLQIGGPTKAFADNLLNFWAQERTRAIDQAVNRTISSGSLLEGFGGWAWYCRRLLVGVCNLVPQLKAVAAPSAISVLDLGSRTSSEGGFHRSSAYEGRKIAQIRLRTNVSATILSDQLLLGAKSALTLLVLSRGPSQCDMSVRQVINGAGLDPAVISADSIQYVDFDGQSGKHVAPLSASDASVYSSLLGPLTRFAIVRRDFVIFAIARNLQELRTAFDILKTRLSR